MMSVLHALGIDLENEDMGDMIVDAMLIDTAFEETRQIENYQVNLFADETTQLLVQGIGNSNTIHNLKHGPRPVFFSSTKNNPLTSAKGLNKENNMSCFVGAEVGQKEV
ncbi:hypothetical protein [Natribacillus halophilus]|uniref:hypothetical protein n=1 Tax=Natribacillus halophilus TaxID=549003 RepID=UPI001C40AC12|nr:hypothetical protein [Natribacillus halophilus]